MHYSNKYYNITVYLYKWNDIFYFKIASASSCTRAYFETCCPEKAIVFDGSQHATWIKWTKFPHPTSADLHRTRSKSRKRDRVGPRNRLVFRGLPPRRSCMICRQSSTLRFRRHRYGSPIRVFSCWKTGGGTDVSHADGWVRIESTGLSKFTICNAEEEFRWIDCHGKI